jgi:hypothetical protein
VTISPGYVSTCLLSSETPSLCNHNSKSVSITTSGGALLPSSAGAEPRRPLSPYHLLCPLPEHWKHIIKSSDVSLLLAAKSLQVLDCHGGDISPNKISKRKRQTRHRPPIARHHRLCTTYIHGTRSSDPDTLAPVTSFHQATIVVVSCSTVQLSTTSIL